MPGKYLTTCSEVKKNAGVAQSLHSLPSHDVYMWVYYGRIVCSGRIAVIKRQSLECNNKRKRRHNVVVFYYGLLWSELYTERVLDEKFSPARDT